MKTDTEIDSDTASMWLHLLATGAVLSAPQLAEFAGVSRRTADTRLWTLTQRGFVLAKTIPGRKNGRGYSVDPTCRIPRGITLAHVLKASAVGGLAPTVIATRFYASLPEERAGDVAVLAPRGELAHLATVSNVFAMGAAP